MESKELNPPFLSFHFPIKIKYRLDNMSWLKGKPRSQEIKEKISKSLKGIKPKNLRQWIEVGKKYRFQKGKHTWNKGKH